MADHTERLQCNDGAATAASATLVPPPRRSSRRLTGASVSTPVPHEIRSIDDSRAQSTASKKRKAPPGSSTDPVSVEPSSKKPATTQAMMHHAESASSSSVMQSRPLSTVGTLLVSISILLVEGLVVFTARCTTAPLLTCHSVFAGSRLCVLCSSLVSTEFVPTPYRCSSIGEVEAWLKVFASSEDIPFEELKVFSIPGRDLLSLTEDQCRKLSRRWGLAIYYALREGTASSNLH